MRKIQLANFKMFLLVFGIATGLAFNSPGQTFNKIRASLTVNFPTGLQNFVVTNADDHGPGSFREAIINANANTMSGTDKIVFNIPGPGVKVISLLTPLPEITDPLIIDATTQPGYAGAPLIELDGANLGLESGLVITTTNTFVGGLAIGRFKAAGIVLRSSELNDIKANYIGVDATGTVARPNNIGIQVVDSMNNLLGGPSAAMRNVISGNLSHGIAVSGNGNVVQGNFIGTNAAGTAAIGNGASGVEIKGESNLIGGTSPGTGNLISGNHKGISGSSTIQGNLIGTDVTGTIKVPNHIGIDVGRALIGGLAPGAGNVISGNRFVGVIISGSDESRLQGNFIGTDISGALDLGNEGGGVHCFADALIGGTVPEARNVIAANGGFGNIVLGVSPRGVVVQGNYIGIDVTGTRALGDSVIGITIVSNNNLIGGLVAGAQNVISGNDIGIQIGDHFGGGPGQRNVIHGNLIGLNALGTGPLPNAVYGISFQEGSSDNTVGGTQSGAANKIAFNGLAGVNLSTGWRNSVRGNSIFSNGGLGIGLQPTGAVTPNDPNDSDFGANNLQNFPVITSVLSFSNGTTIRGSLNSTPNTTFLIDFYSSAALDPSGHGEGALFLSTTTVTTDSNGDATINVSLPTPLGTGRVLTATATDPDGNTSEFSASDTVGVNGNLQFSVNSIRVIEDVGVVNVTVLRKGGSSGTLSIDYATIEGTATAGQDYTVTSGSLTFEGGETSKSFQIPITDDAVTEADETFTVALRNASSLEVLGTPNTLVVTIQDRSTVPVIFLGSATIVEGNTGNTTGALFTFTLSAATARSISVNYATANLSATGGVSCSNQGTDYENASGTSSFQPGSTSVTIPVKICGDTSAEANEQFLVNLSSPSNATLGTSQALGTVIDDDVLELLLDESGPVVNQAVALDAILLLREPFRVSGIPEWFPTSSDRNTRVMFFVRNLQLNPGELSSAVIVRLIASNNQFVVDVPAEDVRSVLNVDFAQVVIRLPESLSPDVYTVTINAHSRTSNPGTIRIAP